MHNSVIITALEKVCVGCPIYTFPATSSNANKEQHQQRYLKLTIPVVAVSKAASNQQPAWSNQFTCTKWPKNGVKSDRFIRSGMGNPQK